MEQGSAFPDITLQQDSETQQPSQALTQQNSSLMGETGRMIENSGSEDISNINISQLLKVCQFKKALLLLEAEFDSKQASLGEFNTQLVPLLNQMAEVQIALAEYSKATDLSHQSVKTLESYQEDPDCSSLLAQAFQSLALISRENQDYREALDLINKSLALPSPDSLQNIEKYRIKALVLCDLQYYKEALQEIQRSLDIVNKSIDTIDNILRVRAYNTLGDIHSTLRDGQQASKAYETASKICRKYDLDFHVEMAKSCEGFGRCLVEAKRSSPVVFGLGESALNIYDKCFPEARHPARIPSFLLLGQYFAQQKKSSRAKEYVMLAIEECEMFYGADCEKIREVCLSAAKVMGVTKIQEDLVAPIRETSTEDKNGRELLNLYLQKCDAYLLCGQYQDFGNTYPHALSAIKSIYGERSLEMVKIYERMVVFYQRKKQPKETSQYLVRIIEIYKEIFGDTYIEIAKAYLTFSGVCNAFKAFLQTTLWLQQALKIQVEFYGEVHPSVIETYILLANAYGFNREPSKSMKTHLKVLRIQEKIGDEKMYKTYEAIGMLYSKFNDTKSSGSYFRKSYQMARVKLGMRDERTLDTKEWSEFNAEEKDLLCKGQEITE